MNWLRNLVRRRGWESAIAEDIEAHLEEKAADLMEAGVPEREARLRARREFGNATLVNQASREVWVWLWLERLVQDVRHGARLMAANPGFTAVAVVTLGLGIGANTAIFGLLDKLAWRMLPVRHAQELRLVQALRTRKPGAPAKLDTSYTYSQYALWREGNRSFQALAGYSALRWRDWSRASDNTWRDGDLVSGNYFDVLGVPAALGRVLGPADDSIEGRGGPEGAAVVVSYRYWRTALHADPGAVGKPLNINGTWATIAGVTPPWFFGMQVGRAPDLFIPVTLQPLILPLPESLLHDPPRGGTTWISVIGRLRPGVSEAQANADLGAIYEAYELTRMSADDRAAYLAKTRPLPRTIRVTPGGRGLSALRARFADPLKALMALVGIVLLITCVNIASLLLARGHARHKEIAVRLAIGAPRGRIVRQFLTESAMLAAAGGAAGLVFAFWSSRALLGMLPQGQAPVGLEVAPDGRVLAFTFAVSAVSALLFGLLPALGATRHSLREAVQRVGESGGRPPQLGLGKGLVALELALSLPLLAAAGLFIGTLRNLTTLDAGFLRQNVLQARINVDRARLPRAQWEGVYERLVEGARTIPGVTAASIINHELITQDATSSGPVHFEGYRFREGEDRHLLETYVGPEYFRATGIPLRLGRLFTPQDEHGRAQTAIVNEALARQYFAGRNPVGMRFGIGKGPDSIEIVGVVADAKFFSLRQDPLPMAYYPWRQVMPARLGALVVRTEGDARGAAAALSKLVNGVHPDLLMDVKTLSSQIDDSVSTERMLARLSGFFGALALALTCVGLYGIMAHGVTRRTREIGIRMALGAARGDVIRMVLGETLAVGAVGLAAGVALALALTRLAGSFLYGIQPNDPAVMAGAAAALVGVSLLAVYVPARRAARVDAVVALRCE